MNIHALLAGGALAALLGSASGHNVASPSTQYGEHPVLPAPHQYLVPPMRVPPGVGWAEGKTPVVSPGLQIQAFATGFEEDVVLFAVEIDFLFAGRRMLSRIGRDLAVLGVEIERVFGKRGNKLVVDI